jgi:HlyD family secretion protein
MHTEQGFMAMRSRAVLRRTVPLAAWLIAAGTAYWLHRQMGGSSQAVGAAEITEYTVSATEAGQLASLAVMPGQVVSRGQALAKLDTTAVEQEIAIAEASVREALAEAQAAKSAFELNAPVEERAFRNEAEDARVTLEAAQSGLVRDKVERAALAEERVRQSDLVARHLTDSRRLSGLDDRIADLDASIAAWPARIEALSERESLTRARLAGWLAKSTGRAGGEALRARVMPAELKAATELEKLKALRIRLNACTLRSPVDGRVTSVTARDGSALRRGNPVAVVVARSARIDAWLDESREPSVAAGDGAEIRLRGNRQIVAAGKIDSVAGVISEIPARFWPAPNRPRWGREIVILVDLAQSLDPGQAVDVVFKRRQPTLIAEERR